MIAQLLEFSGNHILLVGALFIVLGMLAVNLGIGGKGSIDPLQATQMINHEDAVVVDVRSMADFKNGHIVASRNVPLNGFGNQIGSLEKHKGQPIIVGCRSGNTSLAACRQLRKAGFEKVFNLKGGIMAWQAANLPTTRKG
ncbi:MAG: rhodanese-like domain-containing protein [Pseudomonadota bacterium]